MEITKKRTQVHRLLTEDVTSKIWFDNDTHKLLYDPVGVNNCTPQYLYFTTDEKIKKGDWYMYNNQIEQCKSNSMGLIESHSSNGRNPLELLEIALCRKIIASTDPKLTLVQGLERGKIYLVQSEGTKFEPSKLLPQPSQALIKAYCEQGRFDEVDVEYELQMKAIKGVYESDWVADGYKLKVDPIHNTITTHRIVEKMYSRDELAQIVVGVLDALNDGQESIDCEEDLLEYVKAYIKKKH